MVVVRSSRTPDTCLLPSLFPLHATPRLFSPPFAPSLLFQKTVCLYSPEHLEAGWEGGGSGRGDSQTTAGSRLAFQAWVPGLAPHPPASCLHQTITCNLWSSQYLSCKEGLGRGWQQQLLKTGLLGRGSGGKDLLVWGGKK